MAIQDRSFQADGSLFYPESRAFFDGYTGPYIPETPIPPIWNPEFFGDTMVVNGKTWPFLEVEKRRYRFRLLNGCTSRFLLLALDPAVPIWLIGTDGGFLPTPVQVNRLLLSPAQRADVIVDFTHVPVGTEILMRNFGPDEAFAGGEPGVDFTPADPATTGQVMLFRVVHATSFDTSRRPDKLHLPKFTPIGPAATSRAVSLVEQVFDDVGRAQSCSAPWAPTGCRSRAIGLTR
jgi:FtsP/CotA-like multicopper oxidase with cupredoxin domain